MHDLRIDRLGRCLGPAGRLDRPATLALLRRIQGEPADTLPPSLRPDAIFALDLSALGLSAIDPALLQLPALRWLDLSHNRLTELPAPLAALPALHGLVARGNPLQQVDPAVQRLPALFLDPQWPHNHPAHQRPQAIWLGRERPAPTDHLRTLSATAPASAGPIELALHWNEGEQRWFAEDRLSWSEADRTRLLERTHTLLSAETLTLSHDGGEPAELPLAAYGRWIALEWAQHGLAAEDLEADARALLSAGWQRLLRSGHFPLEGAFRALAVDFEIGRIQRVLQAEHIRAGGETHPDILADLYEEIDESVGHVGRVWAAEPLAELRAFVRDLRCAPLAEAPYLLADVLSAIVRAAEPETEEDSDA